MNIKKYIQKLWNEGATMAKHANRNTEKKLAIQNAANDVVIRPYLPNELKGYSNYNIVSKSGYLYVYGKEKDKETSYYTVTTPIIYGIVKQGHCTVHTKNITSMQSAYIERDIRAAKELKINGGL